MTRNEYAEHCKANPWLLEAWKEWAEVFETKLTYDGQVDDDE